MRIKSLATLLAVSFLVTTPVLAVHHDRPQLNDPVQEARLRLLEEEAAIARQEREEIRRRLDQHEEDHVRDAIVNLVPLAGPATTALDSGIDLALTRLATHTCTRCGLEFYEVEKDIVPYSVITPKN